MLTYCVLPWLPVEQEMQSAVKTALMIDALYQYAAFSCNRQDVSNISKSVQHIRSLHRVDFAG